MSIGPDPTTDGPVAGGLLSDNAAVRLYESVLRRNDGLAEDAAGPSVATSQGPVDRSISMKSLSAVSSSELGYPCRICRCDEENVKVVRCPCKCKGSVGFVHINCLKQWILHRRGSRCEICNTQYRLPAEQVSVRRMVRAFFSTRCAGLILKHLVLAASIIPLARIILHQVLMCMDKLNAEASEQLTVNEVLLASCALLTSSALFFNFFEYITHRFLVIRNILRQWWIFGDFELVDPESLTL